MTARAAALIAGVMLLGAVGGWSAAQAEASGSATRGKYLAERGTIIPPDEIHVDSYVASIDYHYPYPDTDVGVYLYSGNRQLAASGQPELIHIGIQGRRTEFEDLPPLNLAFVIDKSGSMGDRDKMEWVKESFAIFIERVRSIDFVALVVFDNAAEVIVPSTKMSSEEHRGAFREAVQAIQPGGGTNLVAGLAHPTTISSNPGTPFLTTSSTCMQPPCPSACGASSSLVSPPPAAQTMSRN